VEFGVEIGEYHGVVRVPRRVLRRLLPEPAHPRAVRRSLQRTRSRPSPSGSSAGAV